MKGAGLFVISFLCFFYSQAKQIEVCDSCDIKSISEAIEQAEDGDEILVKSGVYNEHGILVNKSVSIHGEGLPLVDGEF